MAREVKDLVWVDPLDETEMDYCRNHLTTTFDPTTRTGRRHPMRRLIHPMPGVGNWSLRYYMGGQQRLLGVAPTSKVHVLFRFSGMVQEYFWKYRIRNSGPPTDYELNFERVRLEHDMVHETFALDLLKRMESHLLAIRAIKTSAEYAAEVLERKQSIRRGSLRQTVKIGQIEINERLSGVFEEIEAFEKRSNERIEALVKKLDSFAIILDGILSEVRRGPADAVAGSWPPPNLPGITTPSPFRPLTTGDPLPPNPVTVCGNQVVCGSQVC